MPQRFCYSFISLETLLRVLYFVAYLTLYPKIYHRVPDVINLLKPTGYVMNQQFNIQQLYALPTLYLCVLYLPENKQRLVSLTA